MSRFDDISSPIVYQISDGTLPANASDADIEHFVRSVMDAAEDGVDLFQIREKQLSSRELLRLAKAVTDAAAGRVRIFVNERADIAVAAGADGVHLSSTAMPVDVVRSIVGEKILIAVSTHTASEIKTARDGGADLVVFGPVFDSPGKQSGFGPDVLGRICVANTGFPIVALGGVTAKNAPLVIQANAAGVAAIRSLATRAERRELMRSIR